MDCYNSLPTVARHGQAHRKRFSRQTLEHVQQGVRVIWQTINWAIPIPTSVLCLLYYYCGSGATTTTRCNYQSLSQQKREI